MVVTHKDIAEAAGVTTTSVSLALNGKKGVARDVRKRILKAARDLGYRDVVADGFVDGYPPAIRMVRVIQRGRRISREHEIFISDYFEGAEEEAQRLGYILELSHLRGIPAAEYLRNSFHEALQGLIILGTEMSPQNGRTFEGSGASKIPAVFINGGETGVCDSVGFDHYAAAALGIKHLTENNYGEIGLVRSKSSSTILNRRQRAFKAVMENLGMKGGDDYIFAVEPDFLGAYRNMTDWLRKNRRIPAGLVCDTDIVACACLKALTESGYKVPQETGILGCDDLPCSAISTPRLTTIRFSRKKMGAEAVRLLHDRIQDQSCWAPIKVQVGGELVIRESAGERKG
ncbi:MAG: LacI family transcriptional regulator [Spirochaetales bacterium]|jgi:LacI family transcriptional regulator|nr:LacI family transcriptional regulator [Spirochaetales bacterium]